ncbi:hypothetical protein NIES806_01190 [Dolichospermum compactum NIES-806]|uniref:Uncharacterized protein n=1 Tax=Dolichospermum compactum NIES-806 TaxID=1973481 RepID=A0A1Z4UXW0_9CYAN|nr:hypothetical protein NIES806_01190 [Dolichospermum compactum NIES-806]
MAAILDESLEEEETQAINRLLHYKMVGQYSREKSLHFYFL